MGIVQLFCTYYQSQFPYHIERGKIVSGSYPSETLSSLNIQALILFCVFSLSSSHALVESNDALYGGHSDYKKSICIFIDGLIEKVLTTLTEVGEGGDLVVSVFETAIMRDNLGLKFASVCLLAYEPRLPIM